MRVLVAVATQHGATREIADLIGATIAARGIDTDIRQVEDVSAVDDYDGVVVGSAVYMGNWIRSARAFVEGHAGALAAVPTWMFSSGPIGNPPKPDAGTAVKVDDLVAAAHAREHRLFAGRLQLSRLGVVQRTIARTVRSREGDYRDWNEIQAWAASIADDLEGTADGEEDVATVCEAPSLLAQCPRPVAPGGASMLKASERLGSVVTDNAVAVVWSADDGQVVSATPTFCDLVGWRQGELVGRSAAELGLYVDASDRGAADDTEPWRVTSAQVELRTRSHATMPVEARSHLMRVRGERLVFTVVDAAPQEQGLLELVLDGVPLAIVVLDRDLRIVRVNTRAAAMLHASETESVGSRVRDALPAIAADLEADLTDILAAGPPRLGVELSFPGGRYLASYFPLMAPNGAVNGVGCMFVDVTEQRDAEAALQDSEEHRRLILGQMLRAEEAERSRIALDLHDDTIQVLAAALLKTDSVVALALRQNQTEIASRLKEARKVLAAATERARRLMFELHPTLLDQRGLHAALTALADETGHQIGATWSVDVPETRYAWAVEALTFRIVREAVTNIRKHSGASHFSIELSTRDHQLHGVVRDDGRGFDVQQVSDRAQRPLHLGLQASDERIHLAGGELDVTSTTTPGSVGTTVSFWLPLDHDGLD